ncbi:MAG: class I SAM-dependent methyltransferase [Pedobacter sp.]|nr:MAG: class I SAM-dependent methyltransferase [Pedobacter sp.]
MIGKQYEYEAMATCEKKLWWYKCLHDLTLYKIEEVADADSAILDAGCGTGGMLSRLQNRGFRNLAGFDLSTDAIDYTVKSGFSKVQLLNILECDKAFPPRYFDLIICHDILCLLDDGEDKQAFANLTSLLKPSGLLIMNLPAGQLFKGTHDRAVGIKRRYSKERIIRLASGYGVRIRDIQYWPFLLSPLILSLRLSQRCKLIFNKKKQFKSDVSLPHPLLNNLFYKMTSFENKVMKFKPWGSSIFVTIEKI